MIYLEPSTIGWRPMAKSWISSLPEVLTKENSEFIDAMMEWVIEPTLEFIRKQCKVLESQINSDKLTHPLFLIPIASAPICLTLLPLFSPCSPVFRYLPCTFSSLLNLNSPLKNYNIPPAIDDYAFDFCRGLVPVINQSFMVVNVYMFHVKCFSFCHFLTYSGDY
jgi:hypothetical protein